MGAGHVYFGTFNGAVSMKTTRKKASPRHDFFRRGRQGEASAVVRAPCFRCPGTP